MTENLVRLELPQLKAIADQLEMLNKRLDMITNGWMTQKQFCTNFDIPESTFRLWKNGNQLVTKKIGKVVFVNVNDTFKLRP